MSLFNCKTVRVLITLLALVVIPLQAKGAVLCFEHDGQVNFNFAVGNDGCASCSEEQEPSSSSRESSHSDLCCVNVPLFAQSFSTGKSTSELENISRPDNIVALITFAIVYPSVFGLASPFQERLDNEAQNINLLRTTILLI